MPSSKRIVAALAFVAPLVTVLVAVAVAIAGCASAAGRDASGAPVAVTLATAAPVGKNASSGNASSALAERPYALHVPRDYVMPKPTPLVVLLHGYSASGPCRRRISTSPPCRYQDVPLRLSGRHARRFGQPLLERDRRLLRLRRRRDRRRRLPHGGHRRRRGEAQRGPEARVPRRPLQRRLHGAPHWPATPRASPQS